MNIKSKILLAGIVTSALTLFQILPAQASDDGCDAGPKSGWMTKEAVKKHLAAQGYQLRKIEQEDGCYEAYALKDGAKYELYVNPVTGKLVKSKKK